MGQREITMKNFLRSMRMILARKLTPLKSVGLAFRKDKGDFKSGSKENNSCARDGAGVGCLDKRNQFAFEGSDVDP